MLKIKKKILLVIAVVFFIFGMTVHGTEDPTLVSGSHDSRHRTDLILIDTMNIFGDLEKPPVAFLHEKHTEALEEKGKDCSVCHIPENDLMYQEFMRTETTDEQDVMDVYHDGCIECHNETGARGEETGPVTCGECHKEETAFASSRLAMEMNNSLFLKRPTLFNNN